MSTPARRRHSPAVYRRRRLALVLTVIIVAAVIAVLIWQPWSGSAASSASPSPSPSVSTSSTPPPSATATEPPADDTGGDVPEGESLAMAQCSEGTVEVAPVTDKDSYGAGENPQLTITLTNRSAAPCSMDVGTATQVFTINSGDDVWWRSTDCQSEPTNQVVTIEAGQSVSSATPLTWDRTRSSVSTCADSDRPQAPGGGASFHLSVSIGGVDSASTKQFALN